MTFLWFQMLWFLAAIPALVAAYVLLLRFRKRRALRFANLDLVKQATGPGQRFRRHIPPLLLLTGLTLLVLALARPAAVVTLPSQRETVILAMDVSGSMRATDVDPRRITAAQAAARDFINDQPRTVRVGLVAFSTAAMVMQAPTLNRDDLLTAIDRLEPQRFTAVGSGILVSLKAIFPDADIDVNGFGFHGDTGGGFGRTNYGGVPLGQAPEPKAEPVAAVAPGSYHNAVIILMSDGQTNTGADPMEAARVAANCGIRIFTVGFGSEGGGNVEFEGHSIHVQLDEETLKSIADITRGAYFRAGSEAQLKDVYKTLTTKLVMETQKTEITALFAAAAAAMVILAGVLSAVWFGRFI